jgi:type IV secretory pathway component VirB8
MYAVITADNAIVKNKANFLAEMMAEDILADRTNVKNYSQVFTCNLGQSSSQDQAGLVKDKWNSNFQNILGKNNCTAKDIKQSSINNLDSSININLHLSEGKQKKYLGIKVK